MIQVKNLDIKLGKKKLFTNLNTTIQDGLITGIIGPSGAGKTTLFNSIMGLQKITLGNIYFDNKELTSKNMYDDISYMPQEGGLYEDLTGVDNLNFFSRLNKIKLTDKQIEENFNEFDLLYAKDRKVSAYSGGMKRKLGLMISLLTNGKYFFLDEPTVGIDPVQKEEFWKKLYKLKDSGKTIIVTTHIIDEAARCDRLIFIRDGKIIADDAKENILKLVNTNDLNEAFIKLAGGNYENTANSN